MALTIEQLELQIVAEAQKADSAIDAFIGRLERLETKLNGLGNAGKKAGNGLVETSKGATKATTAIDKQGKSYDKTSKSTKKFTDKLATQISKFHTLYGAFKAVARTMGSWFNESNEYIETLNLFNVTMGDGADAAYKYAESVQNLIGIDIKDWMQYQGVFKNLTSGFGVASKDANIMSQNLTQLSYDMASFFNTNVETAFDKLSSAMSGQVKGLREFGIDTTVESLQEYALAKGIDTKVRAMSQAEKSMLRYNYIMEKSIIMQGDMARTLVTPANAMRVLEAQLNRMKRALGNIVSVLVTQFIPYIQAMVEIVTDAANSLANFFGFELPKIDYSGLDNMTGGFEDAEDSLDGISDSIKKIKKQLMGFDELNIISNPDTDSSASGGDVGSGGLNGMKPLEYDFLANLNTKDLDEIKEKVKDIAKWAGVAAAGFAGWKVGAAVFGVGAAGSGLIAAIKSGDGSGIKAAALALATKFKKAFGIGLMAGGAALDISAAVESWTDGVSWEGLVDQLKGAGLLHLGGFLTGGTTGLGIGAVIDGILSAIPSIKSAVADGNKEWSNTLSIVKGISTFAGGISVITGNWIPVAIGGVIATLAVLIIHIEDIWKFIKSIPERIQNLFAPLTEWINVNIIQPIVGFFAPIGEAIAEVFNYAKEKFIEIKNGMVSAFSAIFSKIAEIANKIKEIFTALWWAFNEYLWNPFVEKLSAFYNKHIQPIVDKVKAVFVKIGGWFKEHIINPIGNWFDTLGEKIVKLRDKAIGVFKKVGTVVVDFVAGLFKTVINGVFWGIELLINGFIKMLNGAINIINKIPGVNITHVEMLSIPRLAEGGIVNEGQMFIAREAGPELVGSIGRKTAVANNDQIISGIESGVYRAMVAANANGNSNGSQTIRIINEIDGDIVGEKVIKYHNGRVMQTGVSPLLV
jgi:predicted translin family RNA/ssDNA-binding protein